MAEQYIVRGSMYHRHFDYYTRNASVSTHRAMEDVPNGVRLCLEAGMQVIVTPWPERVNPDV